MYYNVKPDSFIGKYMQWMSAQETATAYDFWCAIWLISTIMPRALTVARPRAPVHLNTYIILCAEAAWTRKTTAVVQAQRVLAAYNDERICRIEGRASPEGLMDALALQSSKYGDAHAAISIREMVTFFGKEKYNLALPGLLTDLYDCPRSSTTLRSGLHKLPVNNVYLTLLTASTPSWLMRAINPDVIEGGFTSRCMFIHEEKRKRAIAWPEDQDDAVQIQQLVDMLVSLRRDAEKLPGINVLPGALRKFTQWYEQRSLGSDPFIVSFQGREDHHVLRLAAILSISEERFVIDVGDISRAIRIINEVRDKGAAIFQTSVASNRMVQGVDRLRSILIRAGLDGLQSAEITRRLRTYLTADQCKTALVIMHELDMVQRFEVPSGGRPITVWRATKNITGKGALDAITRRLE
jgi:hypothetical protein